MNFQSTELEMPSAAFSHFLNPSLLASLNTQLLETMSHLINVQKENIEGLNAINTEKTQRLIGKIQKNPEIARRLHQLGVVKGFEKSVPSTPVSNKSRQQQENLLQRLGGSEGSLFKKRKLNDDYERKGVSSPESKSDGSSDSDWSDFSKTPKIKFIHDEANSNIKLKINKRNWTPIIDPFQSQSAFKVVKAKRQMS